MDGEAAGEGAQEIALRRARFGEAFNSPPTLQPPRGTAGSRDAERRVSHHYEKAAPFGFAEPFDCEHHGVVYSDTIGLQQPDE
jgi:hypothetical protein